MVGATLILLVAMCCAASAGAQTPPGTHGVRQAGILWRGDSPDLALHEIAGVTGPTAPGDVPTAAPPAAVQDPAAEVTWTLRSLSTTAEGEIDLPGDAEFTLLLRDDGTLSARADCNNCFGDYSMTDDSITIERIGCTRAFCSSSPVDTHYTALLTGTSTVEVTGDQMTLTSQRGTLRFSK